MKKNWKQFINLSLVVSFLFHSGCANTDSSNIKTSGFCPNMSVTKNVSNTSVSVQFTAGCGIGGSYIELSAGDTLSVQVNSGSLQSLNKSVVLGIVTYSTNITANVGDTVTITLHREDEGSYSSSVVVPSAISIISPGDGSTVNNGSSFNVTWTSGGGGSMPVSFNWSYDNAGTTISKSTSTTSSDTGSTTISGLHTTHSRGSTITGATVKLGRRLTGTLNSAFDTGTGSYISATYEDTHTISINP